MPSNHPENKSEMLNPEALSSGSPAAQTMRNLLEAGAGENRSANRAFFSFFENAPDPVLLFSASGDLVAKNPQASTFWDGDADFLPDALIREVTHSGETGRPYRFSKKDQVVIIQTTGGPRFFLPSIFNLLPATETGNGKDQLIACILKDETDWAHSENIRNNLLSSIHHELNTPLTSARVALYLLAEQQVGTLNEVQAELVGRAKEDLDREIATIQNVLALMRSDGIDADRSSSEVVPLHDLLDEVMLEIRELTNSLRLTINRLYSDGAPQVQMERETIRLVIKQVFACMIKHVEKETVIDIVTAVEKNGCFLKLISSDPALVDAMPDDLFALPIESKEIRRVQCVDLGLRVAHEIVQEHGGEVSASQAPEAAVLTLRFPCPVRR